MSNKVLLTTEYWDCECEKKYIHHHTKEICTICKKYKDEQPASHVSEVIEHGLKLKTDMIQ